MRKRVLGNSIIAVCIFVLVLGVDAVGQTSQRVAFRVVSGAPSLYYTSGCSDSTSRAAVVMLARAPQVGRFAVGEDQVFELIDIDGGSLEFGDEVRIKKCGNNYLRVNSGGGLDSVPSLNGDDPPTKDIATVFTVEKPDVDLPVSGGLFIYLKSKRTDKFLEAPFDSSNNGEGLNVMSRDSNLRNRFVIEVMNNPEAVARVSGSGARVSGSGMETVCAGTRRQGWVVYNDGHDGSQCNARVGDSTHRNVWTLLRIEDLPSGRTVTVCNWSSNIPNGWSKISTSRDTSRCGGPQAIGDNLMTIRKN